MEINLLENNNLEIDKNNSSIKLADEQKSFLETNLGQTINAGLNIGIQALLPDVIEDKVIQIKDTLLTQGVTAAVNEAIKSTIDLGKSLTGIFTGNFENVSQVDDAIKKGGLIDSISDILDNAIEKAEDNKIITKKTSDFIKESKDAILKAVNNNIEDNLSNQIKTVDKISTNIENWTNYYEQKDFANMEKQYKKIKTELQEVIPLENIIKKARQLENIHNLIKNNGKNFNLSEDELDLANKLI